VTSSVAVFEYTTYVNCDMGKIVVYEKSYLKTRTKEKIWKSKKFYIKQMV